MKFEAEEEDAFKLKYRQKLQFQMVNSFKGRLSRYLDAGN